MINIFFLDRVEDESQISGKGKVAIGVEFPDKKCVIQWLGEIKSINIYSSIGEVEQIHGHGGKTRVVYFSQCNNELVPR